MSLLSLFRPRQLSEEVGSDGWLLSGGRRSASGINVTPDVAMTYSAVWACTRILSATGATLPLNLMQQAGKTKTVANDDNLQYLVHTAPNEEMTSQAFRLYQIAQQVNAGTAFAEIERDGGKRPLALWPIHHSRVQVKRANDQLAKALRVEPKSLVFEVRNDMGQPDYIPDVDMLRVPSLVTSDGITGRGVIDVAKDSIGMGLATERQGAAFFKNSARPAVVIVGGNFRTHVDREEYRKTWMEVHDGTDNNGRPAMVPTGADIKTLTFSPEASQFLETRQHNIEEVCRWYGVPPHLVQHLLRATYSNIEEQSILFVVYSLVPWLAMWESELNRKLLTREQQRSMYFKFSVNALLRGNMQARAAFYKVLFELAGLSPDEIRDYEDLNPLPDGQGDRYFIPNNNLVPLDRLDETIDATVDGGSNDGGNTFTEPALSATLIEGPTETESKLLADSAMMRESIDVMAGKLAEFNRPPVQVIAEPVGLDAWKDRQRTAAMAVLNSTFANMLDKEIKAASTAARKPPRELFAWIDEYYAERPARLATAMLPALRAVLEVDEKGFEAEDTAKRIADEHVAESKRRLLLATECQPEQLAASLDACLAEWKTRRIK